MTTTRNSTTSPTPADPAAAAPAAARAEEMTAVVQHRYGGLEQLELATVPRPTIAADEVLVEVRAAGIDRGTWHLLTGTPYLMRLMGFGFRGPKNRVPGLDLAGVVVAVGAAVTRFAPGDEVFGIGKGSFAPFAAAQEVKLAPKPAGLSFAEAAVLGVSGATALQAVHDRARVAAGQRVLVLGASGGVGSYAVQMAAAAGAEVTGVCHGAKADLVRTLGASHVIDHTAGPVLDGTRYDAIIDIGGNTSLRRLRRALTPGGALAIVGGEGAGSITGGFGRTLRAVALSPFVGQRLTMVMAREHHTDLERVAALVESGAVRPALERTWPLDQATDALAHLAAGRARGKLALEI